MPASQCTKTTKPSKNVYTRKEDKSKPEVSKECIDAVLEV